MKKILVTLIMAIITCGAYTANADDNYAQNSYYTANADDNYAQNSYFLSLLRQLGKEKNVSEVKVTKTMLGMVSSEVREKVPYLDTVKGLESIDIFTLRSNDAVDNARKIIESYFWYNKNAESLITLTNDKESTYVYGELSKVKIKSNSTEKIYKKIVLFTSTASDKGKFIVFSGNIPASQLINIGKDIQKM